ncbi:DUF3549 family protein [uncultured Microbulbifer sp.]|uniref:DUF3549 family protein n=1 Tax=uncultured Microbulbifer sp. TaxID=348147 RepID=UPI0026143D11|nr:DUF3549 family protein [uncultured Microbulbifer sp.]
MNQNHPTPPSTLTDLIASAEFNLRWFDIGRRVQAVGKKAAQAFEEGSAPWPHPYLRQAWCGLLLWPSDKEAGGDPVVWFLQLPLDEQGKLLLPIRDRFLKQLHEALYPPGNGNNGNAAPEKQDSGKRLQQALESSGLVFTPPAEKRAVFHAKAARLLKRPPSEHFPAARAYAKDPASFPWDQLALQGIADLAVRWEEERDALAASLHRFATPALIPLCQCLESETIDHQLAEPLIRRAEHSLSEAEPDLNLITAVVRGVSHSIAAGMRQQFLMKVLQNGAGTHGEVLAAIGSRCSDDLLVPELAQLWLENLSASQPQQTFNLLLTDLLFLPPLRNGLLGVLRNPERKDSVARAFGEFLTPSGKN